MLSDLVRVEDWRVDYRVRWLFRRFRFGPHPYHVSSPRSPNRTCGFPASRLSSGIMRLAHRSPVASVDDSHGFGTRPLLHPRAAPGVAARPVDALTTPSSSDDPFTFACDASGVSGPLPGFQAFATPGTLPPSVTAPHLRPLPSTGITRLLQYYEPLRHPAGPASPSRGPGSVRASPPTGLPMLLPSSPSMRASVTTPAGPKGCPRRSLPPPSSAFPISQVGRPPHCPFRGLLDVHSRSGPHVR